MKKWVLSRRDSGEMLNRIETSVGINLGLGRSTQANCEEPEDGVVFVNFEGMTFIQTGTDFLPYVGSGEALALFPAATVDEGAIKFILNGADVMRPGITEFDEWGVQGRIVTIREGKKRRAIAVGRSTVASSEAKTMSKGVCLKNLHHVGDKFWTLHKQI